MQLAANEKV